MINLNSCQRKACEEYVAIRIPMLRKEAEKGSTAIVGKFTEALRIVLNVRPVDILRCRAANRADIRIGRNCAIEVKTGSGAVGYSENIGREFIPSDRTAKNVLPNSRYIMWLAFPNECITVQEILSINSIEKLIEAFEKLLENMRVLTREEFIEVLEQSGKKGLESALKISKNGYQLNVQTLGGQFGRKVADQLQKFPSAMTLLR